METGLSLTRIDKIELAELVAVVADIVGSASAESAEGVLIGHVDAIRAILDVNGKRLLCVKDDPIVGEAGFRDNEAHAVLMRSADQKEPEMRALRSVLLTIFGEPQKIGDVRA
jgi:hypothetical protein